MKSTASLKTLKCAENGVCVSKEIRMMSLGAQGDISTDADWVFRFLKATPDATGIKYKGTILAQPPNRSARSVL